MRSPSRSAALLHPHAGRYQTGIAPVARGVSPNRSSPSRRALLYVLFQELERLALDESWAYFLRRLLLGPTGMNIRNEPVHGFVTDISRVYAALTVRAAAMLITVVAPSPHQQSARLAAKTTTLLT